VALEEKDSPPNLAPKPNIAAPKAPASRDFGMSKRSFLMKRTERFNILSPTFFPLTPGTWPSLSSAAFMAIACPPENPVVNNPIVALRPSVPKLHHS